MEQEVYASSDGPKESEFPKLEDCNLIQLILYPIVYLFPQRVSAFP